MPRTTSLLWRAEANPRFTLLGSIHGLDDPQLPSDVVEAFERAEVVVFEADIHQFDMSVLRLPPGRTLSQLISREVYSSILQRAEELGVDPAELEELTIPACIFRLAAQAAAQENFDFGSGVDLLLRQWADEGGKRVAFLEPPDAVHQALGRLPLRAQERWLAFALVGLPQAGARLQAAERAWRSGDLEALKRALQMDEMYERLPEIGEILFASRNRLWANQLTGVIPSQREVLVVVGSGHFFEPHGLLSLLAAEKGASRLDKPLFS